MPIHSRARCRRPALGVVFVVALAALALLATPGAAPAQERRFADEPTAGLSLPTTPLAGDHDATSVALNPAGLVFLGDWHLELAFTGLDEDDAEGPGSGVGLYWASPVALPFLPRVGFGVAVEQLLPPRVALAPDPGRPVRLSLGLAYEWSDGFGVGAAWRHFSDDGGGVLDGVDTLDLGLVLRAGRHFAIGGVVHDLNTPVVDGVPVQRRWQLELVTRPFGTDRLELGLGATLGERRLEVDPEFRFSARLFPGVWLEGEIAALSRNQLENPGAGAGASDLRYGFRASIGLEVSFGSAGAAVYATGGRGVGGDSSLLGATAVLRWSGERLPKLQGTGDHMEVIELSGAPSQSKLTSIVLALRRMEYDGSVKAVLLRFDSLAVGWAGAEDLRDAVRRLRKRGKKVVAYMVAANTREYYVAAAADAILLDAAGGLRLQGLVGVSLYYKGLFDKLGVVAQFEKIEEYKSAPEAFTETAPSEPAKMVRDALFDDIYERVATEIAADRKLSPAQVKALIDAGPYTAEEAGKAKLVDHVVEPDELEAKLAEALGGRFWPIGRAESERSDSWTLPQLAIIYVEGDIVDGKSRKVPILGQSLVGGETIADAIAWARGNPDVVAIVLRVDSPGGSALASEIMAREVEATRGVKPIVVSMGDVAASGGYFCAAYGDRIFAQPSTITGSIGIFTGKVDLSGLLAKLGFSWDITTRGAHADMESYYRPYTEDERQQIKQKLRYYYGRFIGAVAAGRGMTTEEVDAVGRGRVWTGAQAKGVALVDEHGGIYDAIRYAKRQAGYGDGDRVQVVTLPRPPKDLLSTVLRLAGGAADEPSGVAGVPLLGDLVSLLPWSLLTAPDTAQARLPFAIVVD